MKNRLPRLAVGAALIVFLAVWTMRRDRHALDRTEVPERGSSAPVQPMAPQAGPAVRVTGTSTEPGAPAERPPPSSPEWIQGLIGDGSEPRPVPREHLERWLELNRTNAESLLAARQVGGGQDYLLAALTNHPNDPRVLFNALTLNDSAEARRERLERFKAAAPDNALVDFLSAREHFKSSQPEQALADLTAAAQKQRFDDYAQEAAQAAEELYLSEGRSPAEAKALACSSVLLPHLSQLKALAQDMAGLERQYVAAGDAASAENLAQYGLLLSRHLTTGEGSSALIDQLVGYAVERIVLSPLAPDQPYAFLEGTVAERLAQLDAQKAAAKADARLFGDWMPHASETELLTYFERLKVFGESSAMAWLRARQAAP